MRFVHLSALLIGLAASTQGALMINNFGQAYTENFNGLGISGGTWTDNSTLPNWYSSEPAITAGDGTATTPGLYNFAEAGDPVNRSLGSVGGTITFGIQFLNNTGDDIGQISVDYIGKTWRSAASVNRLTFEYFIGTPSSIDSEDAGWTAVSALNYTSTTTGSSLAVNATIQDLSIADGQSLWFRWVDANSPGTDASLGIDDMSITVAPVPEPSFYSLAAACFLGLLAISNEWRVRRRAINCLK